MEKLEKPNQTPESGEQNSLEISQINDGVQEELREMLDEEFINPFYEFDQEFERNGLDFKITCSAIPVIYEVSREGKFIGMIRLRKGIVQAWIGTSETDMKVIYDVNYREKAEETIRDDICTDKDRETMIRLITEYAEKRE